MDNAALSTAIEDAFEQREHVTAETQGPVRDAVDAALSALDSGACRVAEKKDGAWHVNQWLKKAVLLSFRLNPMARIGGAPGGASWWDKVPSKFAGWSDADFVASGFPSGARLRRQAFRLYCPRRRADAVLRQSRRLCRQRHHGRHLGNRRLLRADRQERASLGRRRHRRRAGAAAGGPVIIEDNCFIGARSEVVEGVVVEEGAVLPWACSSAHPPRSSIGKPARSTMAACRPIRWWCQAPLPGAHLPSGEPGPSLGCAVIVKRVDARTREKTAINELLRT